MNDSWLRSYYWAILSHVIAYSVPNGQKPTRPGETPCFWPNALNSQRNPCANLRKDCTGFNQTAGRGQRPDAINSVRSLIRSAQFIWRSQTVARPMDEIPQIPLFWMMKWSSQRSVRG
jgi:hypothetical protein